MTEVPKKKMNPAYVRALVYGGLFVLIVAYLLWKGAC